MRPKVIASAEPFLLFFAGFTFRFVGGYTLCLPIYLLRLPSLVMLFLSSLITRFSGYTLLNTSIQSLVSEAYSGGLEQGEGGHRLGKVERGSEDWGKKEGGRG